MRRPDLREKGTLQFMFFADFTTREERDQYIVEIWERGSGPIQKMLGAQGTHLHALVENELRLVAIAQWESKGARDRAFEILREKYPPDSVVFSDGPAKITVVGHGIEIASVLPRQKRKRARR